MDRERERETGIANARQRETGNEHVALTHDNDTDSGNNLPVFFSVVRDQDFGEECTVDAAGPWCRSDLICDVCDSEDAMSTCQILNGGERSLTYQAVI